VEDETVRTIVQTAFDRVEKLTGQANKLRAQIQSYEDLPQNLASARSLLGHIANNLVGLDSKGQAALRDVIQLELRRS
jgi:hypothetical protein